VLFLRYRERDPRAAAALIQDVIAAGAVIKGRFTVIEEDGIRQRIY